MRPDDKRKLTSRLNSLESTGPKTNQGKQASSANSRTHGAYASMLVLPGEKLEDYQYVVDSHFRQFKPANPVEENLVALMATTMWRINRQAPAEASLVQIQLQRMNASLEAEFERTDSPGLYSLAISSLHNFGDAPAQIARQERRLLNHYRQLRKEFIAIREMFPPDDTPNLLPDSGPVTDDIPSTAGIELSQSEQTGAQLPETQPTETEKSESVETKLTAPANSFAPLRMLSTVTRVHNPRHPLYASLPPLPELPARNTPPKPEIELRKASGGN